MKLEQIPVVALATPAQSAMLSGNAAVLLQEIAERLQQLLEGGQTAIIDLLAMPLNAADLDWLRQQLGIGEVRITLAADRPCKKPVAQASGGCSTTTLAAG